MQAEDRPIHFSTELIHPPVEHSVPVLQKLYFDLSQTRAAYLNTEFTPPAPPQFHSKRSGKAQSVALFLPDRIAIIEEWVDMPLSVFIEKVEVVCQRAMEVFDLAAVPFQTVTIRTTFALTHFEDARVFLLDHVCAQQGRIAAHLGRPVATGGLRFVLPETPGHRGNLHVVIESYRYSQHEVFVEVKGVFPNQPIQRGEIDRVRENIRLVRDFIDHGVFPYVAEFDASAP
jgi:hypothetical protein